MATCTRRRLEGTSGVQVELPPTTGSGRPMRSRGRSTLILGVALPLLASACGGGGDGPATVITLISEQIAEGCVWSDGTVVTAGTYPLTPLCGDIDHFHPGVSSRQFMSFLLDRIPPEVRIEGAVLRVQLREVLGSPFLS